MKEVKKAEQEHKAILQQIEKQALFYENEKQMITEGDGMEEKTILFQREDLYEEIW